MAGFHLDDTIAAVSTAMAPAGIGIVRISGNDAFEVADRVFRAKKEGKQLSTVKSHTIHYGWITEGEEVIDEVLVMVMKGPKTYTGENTVEIDCHGGVLAVKKVLEAVLHAGARAADPGEFTKRAFLNGRMDLTQAEAVMDVISAKSAYALKSSESQLRGTVKKAIRAIRKKLIYEIAFIESALDDPEHISLDGYPKRLAQVVAEQKKQVEKLLASADEGKMIQEGIKTVILGKPNAGKSSLLNLLAALDKPTGGTVILDGRDLGKIKESDVATFRRDNLGFVFQEFNLLDTFTIQDNILLPLVLAGKRYDEMTARLLPIAKDLGLTALLKKYPYEVSGGQKQRLALAVNLTAPKRIYIFDEATGNIDAESEGIIMEVIRSLSTFAGVTVITHRLANVAAADSILYMEDGRICEQGDHASLMARGGRYAALFCAQRELEQGYLELIKEAQA